MAPEHPVGALVCSTADRDGKLLGLAHYVLHPHTFSSKMVCYLEDLRVDPSARRAGFGGPSLTLSSIVAESKIVNIGRAAGQNRMHVHVHLIPRYIGDVVDASGGIRWVLSNK